METNGSVSRVSKPKRPALSCKSCRTRKLRCDKAQPCNNCTTRSIRCEPGTARRSNKGAIGKNDTAEISPDVLARLQRLEELVVQKSAAPPLLSPISTSTSHQSVTPISAIANIDDAAQQDSRRLEALNNFEKSLLPGLCGQVHFRIASNDEESMRRNGTFQTSNSHSSILAKRQIPLPPKHVAQEAFQSYIASGDHYVHLIHLPSARANMDEVYRQLDQDPMSTPPGVLLVLAITALATLVQPAKDNEPALQPIQVVRNSAVYAKAALDLLDHIRRTNKYTLQDVQALIILLFFFLHVEGFSPRPKFILSDAIAIAKSMSLHLLDAKGPSESRRSDVDELQQEVKRRVWWYLAATDWLVSSITGGYYSINPKHMKVNFPRHIQDNNDFKLGPEVPLTQPTPMSYFFQRVRIAEFGRLFIDEMPADPSVVTYELVVSLDARISAFEEGLPSFFRFDNADQCREIDLAFPYVPIQRHIIGVMINMTRCKFHQPFLVSPAGGPLHELSRATCLRAARTVITTRHSLAVGPYAGMSQFMKAQGLVQHLLLSAVVFAVDLCYNKPQGEDREMRIQELKHVCDLLYDLQQFSPLANKFLESIDSLLQRHGVSTLDIRRIVGGAEGGGQQINVVMHEQVDEDPIDEQQLRAASNDTTFLSGNEQYNGQSAGFDTDFEQLWQTFMHQPSMMDLLDFNGLNEDSLWSGIL